MKTRNQLNSPFDSSDRAIERVIRAAGGVIDVVTYYAYMAFWWYVGLLIAGLFGAACLRAVIQLY